MAISQRTWVEMVTRARKYAATTEMSQNPRFPSSRRSQPVGAARAIAWVLEEYRTRSLERALEYELVIQLERAIAGRLASVPADSIPRPTKPLAMSDPGDKLPVCAVPILPVFSRDDLWVRREIHARINLTRSSGVSSHPVKVAVKNETRYLSVKLIKHNWHAAPGSPPIPRSPLHDRMAEVAAEKGWAVR